MLKIQWHKGECGRLSQVRRGKHFMLPLLCRRKIHLEDSEPWEWIAPCECIQTRAENHILRDALRHGPSELIFDKSAASRHEAAKIARDLVLGAFHVAGRRFAHEADCDRIVEHRRFVHQLVRGAAHGYAECGLAGSAGQHPYECKRPQKIVALRHLPPRTIVSMSWIGWALLSAVFAAATALLAKVGVAHVDSNLAMALRTTVVLFFAWGIALALGKHGEIRALDRRTLLFLALSGAATGLSWICYFRALQLGPASRVAPLDKMSVPLVMLFAWLLLGEKLTLPAVVGGLLITAGAIVMVLG